MHNLSDKPVCFWKFYKRVIASLRFLNINVGFRIVENHECTKIDELVNCFEL